MAKAPAIRSGRPRSAGPCCPGRTPFTKGRCRPPAAFVAAQRLEDAPFLGDAWFYRALSALGQGTTRLLETDDGTPLPPPPPLSDSRLFARLQLQLTATGEDVLRGEADRVELLAVDRWIGGTHLTGETTWRWDPSELQLVRPSACWSRCSGTPGDDAHGVGE
jgi:hypothetical protein